MSEVEEKDLLTEASAPVQEVNEKKCCISKKCNCRYCRCIFDIVLVLAIVGLYVLYLFFPKSAKTNYPTAANPDVPRSGEVVYINIDTINAQYALVDILTKDIEAEMAKQEAIFQNRQSALEKKAAQFQQNYQSGVLNQTQVEYAQQQLMQESETLQADYQRVMEDLNSRQSAALMQITDSVVAATKRVNAARNASFVYSYQYGGQLIDADPSKDITNEVLELLNEHYNKTK